MKRWILFVLCLMCAPGALAGPSTERMLGYLGQLITEQPDNPVLYLRRAHTYAEIHQWPPAYADLERVAAFGEPLTAALNRGDFLSRNRQWGKAEQQFNRVLAAQPNNYRALLKRAEVLAAQDKDAAALADYRRLFTLKSDAASGQYRKAAELTLKLEGAQTALALLDERMHTTGPIPQLQNLAIDIEQRHKNYASAIARMQTLSALSRGSPFWHTKVASLHLLNAAPGKANYHIIIAEDLLAAHRQTRVSRALKAELTALKQQYRAVLRTLTNTVDQ